MKKLLKELFNAAQRLNRILPMACKKYLLSIGPHIGHVTNTCARVMQLAPI